MFKNATFLSFYFADNQLFSNSETLGDNYTASLTDLSGRLLLQFPIENGYGEGFKKDLDKGIYIINISNVKYRFAEKLFIF